ncbi:MAG: hypothetical protein ACP5K5_03950, partial [Candidatus Micrarchaeia archaeon]
MGTHLSSNLVWGTLARGMLILVMVLIYVVFIPVGIIVNSGIYHLIIKNLFKMYKQNYNAAFTAFTYGMIPIILVYWLLPVPLLNMMLLAIFGLWSFIIEIIAISNLLSMSRLKALGTIILDGIIVGIIIYVIVVIIGLGLFSLGLFNPALLTSTKSSSMQSSGVRPISIVPISTASGPNLQPETNLGSATGIYNGKLVYLTIVPQRTVESFPDVTPAGFLSNFSTTNKSYSCLDGASIRVWTASNEYPGYLVAHNGDQGSQCTYVTAIFKT